jgi:hypothetical protein
MLIPDPGILIFRSRVKKITDPGSASNSLSNLTQKIVSKLPDLDFLPIPDPRVKKVHDPGSRFATYNGAKTVKNGYILCDTFPEQVSSCLKQFFGQHKAKVPGFESSVGLTKDPLSYWYRYRVNKMG